MADARREYTAVFSIGGKLLGSFHGAFTRAQAQMTRLQAGAMAFGRALRRVALGLITFTGVLGAFAVGKVFKDLFSGATDEALQAHQRVRVLTSAFTRLSQIRKSREPLKVAQEQVKLLQDEAHQLSKNSVLHEEVYEEMATNLARYGHMYPQETAKMMKPLGELLVELKGVSATEQDAAELGRAFGMAIYGGNMRAVRSLGILSKEQMKMFNKTTSGAERYMLIMQALGRYSGTIARSLKTPEGRIQLLTNYIRTLRHEIGEELLPIQAKMAEAWLKVLPRLKQPLLKSVETFGRVTEWTANQVVNFVNVLSSSRAAKAWADLTQSFTGVMPKGRSFGQLLGDLIVRSIELLVKGLRWLRENAHWLVPTIKYLTIALVSLKLAFIAAQAVAFIKGNIIIVGAAAAIAAVVKVRNEFEKTHQLLEAQSVSDPEHFTKHWYLANQTWSQFVINFEAGVKRINESTLVMNSDKAWSDLAANLKKADDWLKPFVESFKSNFVQAWKDLRDNLGTVDRVVKGPLTAVGMFIKDFLLSPINQVIEAWKQLLSLIGKGPPAPTGAAPTGGGGGFWGGLWGGVKKFFGATGAAPAGLTPPGATPDAASLAKIQAERAAMIKELNTPHMQQLLSATLASEANDLYTQGNVAEALLNRGAAAKIAGNYTSMEQMIKGGFYGPWNRGEVSARMAAGSTPERMKQVQELTDALAAGRNVTRGMTDQGMWNEIKGYKEKIGTDWFGMFPGRPEQFQTEAFKAVPAMQQGGVAKKHGLYRLAERGSELVLPLKRLASAISWTRPSGKPTLNDLVNASAGTSAGSMARVGRFIGNAFASQPPTQVNFSPTITIQGNASEAEQRAMDTRLRDLARDFIKQFQSAQYQERRLSYQGGYG